MVEQSLEVFTFQDKRLLPGRDWVSAIDYLRHCKESEGLVADYYIHDLGIALAGAAFAREAVIEIKDLCVAAIPPIAGSEQYSLEQGISLGDNLLKIKAEVNHV